MEAKELRIGSTYQSVKFNLPVTLEAGDFYNLIIIAEAADISHYIDGYVKPIPLTEEWLVKFGFEKIDHIHGYSFWNLRRKRGGNVPSICIHETFTTIGNNTTANHVEYVHQLQNLYFALTGKELELNA